MKNFFKQLFLEQWQRKAVSVLLAIGIWLFVDHSITFTKTMTNIPVKIINSPPGKTIEGLCQNNIFTNRITLTLTGNKSVINKLSSKDLGIILDASYKGDEWIETISKKNLICFNPDIDLSQSIDHIEHNDFIVKLGPISTERVPIYVSAIQGKSPARYKFLNIWPSELFITLKGAKQVIQNIKKNGLSLLLNLEDISQTELDRLKTNNPKDIIHYSVPNAWKLLEIPEISSSPLQIDDPNAENLCIDFVEKEQLPLDISLPIQIFCSSSDTSLHPEEKQGVIKEKNGVFFYTAPLFVRGVNLSFLNLIKDHLELVIFPTEKICTWSIEPLGTDSLIKKYIQQEQEQCPSHDTLTEEHLKFQFQQLLRSINFYQENEDPLALQIELQGQKILITPKKAQP